MKTFNDYGLVNWHADYTCSPVEHHSAYDWSVGVKAAYYSGYNAVTRESEALVN